MKNLLTLFVLILLISCSRPTNKDIYYAYVEREKDRKEHPEKYKDKENHQWHYVCPSCLGKHGNQMKIKRDGTLKVRWH